jgi:hypothetical protein
MVGDSVAIRSNKVPRISNYSRHAETQLLTWSQDKQIGRTVTLATALSTIASASDIFTPLRIPPAVLPGYLTIDTASQWHNSALLAAAIETATLPTRLHARVGGMGRISELASLLNVSGNQRIAMLSMSVVSGPEKSTNEDDDERVRLPKLSAITDETRIECSWDNNAAKPWRYRKKEHIFAEANVSRGFDEDEEEEAEDSDRAEDSYEEQPIISRWGPQPLFTISLCLLRVHIRTNFYGLCGALLFLEFIREPF